MSQTSEVRADAGKATSLSGFARQTVEFVVVLILCILLFRTFAAEAYIVPTGSMAPTLLGIHRELVCPSCGFRFAVGQDDEHGSRAVCPNCAQDQFDRVPAVVCNGDRVLVQKYLYDFRRPKRWEVAVFHFPNEPIEAYVKRVVGLPGEEIRIAGGDVLVNGRIARKTLKEQRGLRVLVYDHNFLSKDHRRARRWEFRKGSPRDNAPSGWRAVGSTFVRAASAEDDDRIDWVDYRHYDPDRKRYAPIYDFCPYNGADVRGENVVSDLMVEARIIPSPDVREVCVRINSGSDSFVVAIGVRSNEIVVKRRDGRTVAITNVRNALFADRGSNRARLLEASIMDRRLSVAIDGEPIFDPVDYDDPAVGQGPGDRPIGVGASGGGALSVSDFRIYRDIYYTSRLASTPRRPFGVDAPYVLGRDEYFVLGDNSAVSNDSRFWVGSPVVPASLLLGKPFLVHLPGQVVPLQVFGRSVYWVPDPREIRYIR
jgi:signal peptidase I